MRIIALLLVMIAVLATPALTFADEGFSVYIVVVKPTSEYKWEVASPFKAVVPERTLVTVRNASPVQNGERAFFADDECVIINGGTVTSISEHGEGDETLVLVEYKYHHVVYGEECPTGTEYLVPKDVLWGMTARAMEVQKEKEEIRMRVNEAQCRSSAFTCDE